MAQRYSKPIAQERMAQDKCPECGEPAESHVDDIRMWVPRRCSLLPHGVTERIAQYRADENAAREKAFKAAQETSGAWHE